MTDVKWTPTDNRIAEVELQLSEVLTTKLTARPEISLRLLYASKPIRTMVNAVFDALEAELGRHLIIATKEYREGDRRRVMVEIIDKTSMGAS